jgi:hypothetical protein
VRRRCKKGLIGGRKGREVGRKRKRIKRRKRKRK